MAPTMITSSTRALLMVHLLVLGPMMTRGLWVTDSGPSASVSSSSWDSVTMTACMSACTLSGVACLTACPSQGLNGPVCFNRCTQDGLACLRPCTPYGSSTQPWPGSGEYLAPIATDQDAP